MTLFGTFEIAQSLGLGLKTVKRYIREQGLPATRIFLLIMLTNNTLNPH